MRVYGNGDSERYHNIRVKLNSLVHTNTHKPDSIPNRYTNSDIFDEQIVGMKYGYFSDASTRVHTYIRTNIHWIELVFYAKRTPNRKLYMHNHTFARAHTKHNTAPPMRWCMLPHNNLQCCRRRRLRYVCVWRPKDWSIRVQCVWSTESEILQIFFLYIGVHRNSFTHTPTHTNTNMCSSTMLHAALLHWHTQAT